MTLHTHLLLYIEKRFYQLKLSWATARPLRVKVMTVHASVNTLQAKRNIDDAQLRQKHDYDRKHAISKRKVSVMVLQ